VQVEDHPLAARAVDGAPRARGGVRGEAVERTAPRARGVRALARRVLARALVRLDRVGRERLRAARVSAAHAQRGKRVLAKGRAGVRCGGVVAREQREGLVSRPSGSVPTRPHSFRRSPPHHPFARAHLRVQVAR